MKYLSLDEIHAELFALLKTFDCFAKENGLRYSIDAGTLIGAVRHGGFIPWDDDIDVIMPRPDFERMMTLADKTPKGYRLSYISLDGLLYPFAKFVNTHVAAKEGKLKAKGRYLWIDIFPADGMSDDEEVNRTDFEESKKLQHYRLFQTTPAKNSLLNIIKKPMRLCMNAYRPPKKTIEMIIEVALRHPFDKATWCRDIVCGNCSAARLRTQDFNELIELNFCGTAFPAIPHWDEYLKSQYGDYMTLPPENERSTHHIKAWHLH